jgi:gas vesicle protein
MTGNSCRQSVSVFLVGLGVGAGLGLLFAPKSGETTRGDVADAVKDGADSMTAQGKKLRRRAQNTFEQARAHGRDVAEHLSGRS